MTTRNHNNTKTLENMIFKPLPVQFWMSSFRTEDFLSRRDVHKAWQLQLTQAEQEDDGLLTAGSILQEPGSSGSDHGTFETWSQDSQTLKLLLS